MNWKRINKISPQFHTVWLISSMLLLDSNSD